MLGHRARYLPPLRLYLLSSFLFFLYLSFQNTTNNDITGDLAFEPMVLKPTVTETARAAAKKQSTQNRDLPIEQDAESGSGSGSERSELSQTAKVKLPLETNSDIKSAMSEIEIGWLGQEDNAHLRTSLQARADKAQLALQEDPGQIADAFLNIAPGLMFLLVPLFALLLKIVYLASGRFYAEHLVLAVYTHSALFAIILFNALLEWLEDSFRMSLGSSIVLIWIPVYMFISLRRVFDESLPATALKFSILGLSYLTRFSFAFVFGSIAGIMTL